MMRSLPVGRSARLHKGDEAGGYFLDLPSLRHTLPTLVEGVVGPAIAFYLALVLFGFKAALYTAFGWSCAAVLRRVLLGQRVPATVMLSVLLLAGRTVIGVLTKSAVVYFLQPSLGTILIGLVFLVSALAKRPVIARLAQDFCPLPDELLARDALRRFFQQISLLWATVMLLNAALTITFLLTTTLRAFVVERSVVSWSLSSLAIVLSVLYFSRTLARENIRLRLRRATA